MIDFESENIELPKLDQGRIAKWIHAVASHHGYQVGNLHYRFCDDETILKANREFVNHDYYTDIITFDYTLDNRIGGDILISLDTVGSNAKLMGASYDQELLRVIIHGVLHLCGIDDKGPGEREIMEANENEALQIWEELQ